jgi:uncharacterized protein with PIN domain
MSAVVSKKGVKDRDIFTCDDCGDSISGSRVLDGEMVYYVKEDRSNPNNNVYRCADCADEIWANYYY